MVAAAWDGRDAVGDLRELHFRLYRLMWAKSRPGKGGDRICPYGQAKLAARLQVSVPTVKRLIADLREPGADVRHPDVKPAGLRLGWVEVLPRERPGGRGGRLYGGNRYVLHLSLEQLAAFEAQVSGHTPRSDRRITAEAPVSAGQIEGSPPGVILSRYVRSTPTTGGAFTHPESGLAGSNGLDQPRTNNGRRRWIPADEYVPLRAAEIAAGPDGLKGAEAYLAECRRRAERQERMRAAGRAAMEREARGELEPRPRPPVDPATLSPEQRRALAQLEALPGFPDELRVVSKVTGKVRLADDEADR
jgi:hypothetical protein